MTTITVNEDTHSNVVKLQSLLNLTSTSGTKYSLSDTVNYAVSNSLNGASGVSFSFVQQPAAQTYATYCSPMAQTSTSQTVMLDAMTYTSSHAKRFSLREDK